MKRSLLTVLLLSILASCSNDPETTETKTTTPETKEELVENIGFKLIRTIPHDTTSFTEGLLVHKGRLYESTGSPNDLPSLRSVLGPVDTATGKIDVKAELDRKTYFGEGIVILNDKIYQLTYKNQ